MVGTGRGQQRSSRWTRGEEAARKGEDKRKGACPPSPGHSAVSLCPVCALAPRQCGWVGCLRLAAAMAAQVVALRHTKARGCQQPPPPHHPGIQGLLERSFYSLCMRGGDVRKALRWWELREDRNLIPQALASSSIHGKVLPVEQRLWVQELGCQELPRTRKPLVFYLSGKGCTHEQTEPAVL